ncbi:unnamed protein product [Spirodela intermedia]|uniref:Uncharacterized protein n=2 Tax=Spirodela intermedia TaxID=51605 RepID=A0A7I8LAJ3_SPIIN|nr:unnamed protein product [Spirodela intermedia]CAA6669355.1 unnamed protein product [Spirodela intermedia]CAA7406304.1 unnamed protein product [Spirodela intermedia]
MPSIELSTDVPKADPTSTTAISFFFEDSSPGRYGR